MGTSGVDQDAERFEQEWENASSVALDGGLSLSCGPLLSCTSDPEPAAVARCGAGAGGLSDAGATSGGASSGAPEGGKNSEGATAP
jgi:hypothetical protein